MENKNTIVDAIRQYQPKHIILLDCGGWKASTVKFFRKKFDPDCKVKIHAFEPNPVFFHFYQGLKNQVLHKQAVWIFDGEIALYLQKIDPIRNNNGSGGGDSLMQKKTNVDATKSIKVPCIDFSKWIIKNFKKTDYIILKMNIEGAEYKVLSKMIKDGSIGYIKELFIEWHHLRYPEIATEEEYKKIISKIKIPIQKNWLT